jgi:hypothetical protein
MGKTRTAAGRAIRWLGAGAAVGGCLGAPDGLVLAAVLAGPWALWAGCFALGGAALGGLVGLLAAVLGPRMVLRPPDDDEGR